VKELLLYINVKNTIFFSIAPIVISVIVHLLFKRHRFIKYLPGMVLLLYGIFNLYRSIEALNGIESLNQMSLGALTSVSGVVGLATALIIGIYHKPIKNKRKRTDTANN